MQSQHTVKLCLDLSRPHITTLDNADAVGRINLSSRTNYIPADCAGVLEGPTKSGHVAAPPKTSQGGCRSFKLLNTMCVVCCLYLVASVHPCHDRLRLGLAP